MAQTNFTPISIYYSATATNVPTAGNLVAGELAINTNDGKLFYKDSSGVVQTLASKSTSSGVFTSVTDSGLTSGRVTYATTGGLLTDSANMTFDGSTLTTLNSAYTGTLTGGTGVVNLGSGQFYKDASGNLGLGVTPSGNYQLQTQSNFTSGSKGFSLSSFSGGTSGNGIPFVGYNIVPTSTANSYKYSQTDVASALSFYDGVKFYVAASGTAGNAITFTTAMILDASGNLLVGTTSTNNGAKLSVTADASATQVLGLRDSATTYANNNNYILFSNSAGNTNGGITHPAALSLGLWGYTDLRFFYSSSALEAARIDSSGSLLIGRTSNARSARLEVTGSGSYANGISVSTSVSTAANYEGIYTSASGTAYFGLWTYNGTSVGSISSTGTVTVYSTTSDYRLKTNVSPMTGALATVQALKPVTYKWKTTGEASQGFIAHELQAVVPECVVGEKDAVNEDGSIKPQGIDTSFLVATLTAAIQEQQALIESLTTRLTALENK